VILNFDGEEETNVEILGVSIRAKRKKENVQVILPK